MRQGLPGRTGLPRAAHRRGGHRAVPGRTARQAIAGPAAAGRTTVTSAFLAVEGPNGVGKTTIATRLATQLRVRTDRPVHLTSEPTDTPLGRLLGRSGFVLQGRALALALAADRAAHIEIEIIPALDDGSHVVTDRYVHDGSNAGSRQGATIDRYRQVLQR